MVDEVASAPAHVLAALDRLSRRASRDLRARLVDGEGGLRGSHGRLLELIAEGGSRPSSLADGAWITKQAVGARLRELEQRGLVSISPDPTDRRAVVVRRTADGDRVCAAARRAIVQLEEAQAAVVGADRYATFRAVLDELAGLPPGGDAA